MVVKARISGVTGKEGHWERKAISAPPGKSQPVVEFQLL
jgi:hypothetical protein